MNTVLHCETRHITYKILIENIFLRSLDVKYLKYYYLWRYFSFCCTDCDRGPWPLLANEKNDWSYKISNIPFLCCLFCFIFLFLFFFSFIFLVCNSTGETKAEGTNWGPRLFLILDEDLMFILNFYVKKLSVWIEIKTFLSLLKQS